jgi:hypothetical protein
MRSLFSTLRNEVYVIVADTHTLHNIPRCPSIELFYDENDIVLLTETKY